MQALQLLYTAVEYVYVHIVRDARHFAYIGALPNEPFYIVAKR